jgi:Domain of unknown function (DUF4142)
MQNPTNPAMNSDHEFAMKAASGGLAEVKLGHLAEERGMNPAVKEFGKRMVADHSKANVIMSTISPNSSGSSSPLRSGLRLSVCMAYERVSRKSPRHSWSTW